MAALVDPAHVKGVIAEGVTPIGMGLPDEIKVPLLLAFGKLDDFGVSDSNGKRWNLTDDCRLNIQVAQAPVGSSVTCNQSTPGKRIPTPLEWADSVQKRAASLKSCTSKIWRTTHILVPCSIAELLGATGKRMGHLLVLRRVQEICSFNL